MTEPKIIVTFENGEVEILANREGMNFLSDICAGLGDLTDEEARTPANHWHINELMNTAEKGSIPMMITLKLDL